MLFSPTLPAHRSVLALFLLAATSFAQSAAERSTSAYFARVQNDPLQLYQFLLRMPKGGDLHNHVSGAVYAETYIKEAAGDGLCIDVRRLSFVEPGADNKCGDGLFSARRAETDNDLNSRMVDSLSMRDFVPGAESGHDHFFATFDKFALASHGHEAEALAEVVQRAADQNESYLELMALTAGGGVSALAEKAGLPDDFDRARESLLAAGLARHVERLRAHVDEIEKARLAALHCDTAPDSAACHVTVRYVVQVLRNAPKGHVFAQIMASFLLAQVDPRVVAVNLVQPEDWTYSMNDYALHMKMLEYARRQFPSVHLTLHAGELAPGLVPPQGLQSHIAQAVTIAHAERIGHGVDIGYETNAAQTLAIMAKKHIDVEINLTSNEGILGISGANHPFPLYRRMDVPVTLSTDDEGVARTQLTLEFRRAVQSYHLTYADVKTLVRNSIEYSFLPGASYWSSGSYRQPMSACLRENTAACRSFIAASEKARVQLDLEQRFAAFEASVGSAAR